MSFFSLKDSYALLPSVCLLLSSKHLYQGFHKAFSDWDLTQILGLTAGSFMGSTLVFSLPNL